MKELGHLWHDDSCCENSFTHYVYVTVRHSTEYRPAYACVYVLEQSKLSLSVTFEHSKMYMSKLYVILLKRALVWFYYWVLSKFQTTLKAVYRSKFDGRLSGQHHCQLCYNKHVGFMIKVWSIHTDVPHFVSDVHRMLSIQYVVRTCEACIV